MIKAKRNPPLSGIRVLVGRARHQASALTYSLIKKGAEVLEIPFIEIRKPRSYKPLDEAIKKLHTYDWLIFTSVNGVEAFWERYRKLKLHQPPRLKIAAIGPATKRAIEKRGYKVAVVPKEYIAESVVKSLRSRIKGKRVLLARARVARDVIPQQLRKEGARVDVVEAYETVIPRIGRSRLNEALNSKSGRPQVITFTSSSAAKNFFALLDAKDGDDAAKCKRLRELGDIRIASIGPVTSGTLRTLGFKVHIEAAEYTIPGLVAAIVSAFASGE
ncbi:MAG: uroporphyrinogen-III synthase [Terriglobales bacterium]